MHSGKPLTHVHRELFALFLFFRFSYCLFLESCACLCAVLFCLVSFFSECVLSFVSYWLNRFRSFLRYNILCFLNLGNCYQHCLACLFNVFCVLCQCPIQCAILSRFSMLFAFHVLRVWLCVYISALECFVCSLFTNLSTRTLFTFPRI